MPSADEDPLQQLMLSAGCSVQSFASAASHSPKPLQHKGRKDAGVEEEGGERPENGADHERAEVVAALLDRYRAAYFRDGRPEVR